MRIFNAAVAAALFSFACATTGANYSHVNVKTLALESGARDARGLKPVAGVAVSVKCPNGQSKEIGKTEADGTLRVDADTNVSMDCSVGLAQDGFKPEEHKVSTVCTETAAGSCLSLDLSAILSHSAEARSAGAKQ